MTNGAAGVWVAVPPWIARAEQTAKIKRMFLPPGQVAALVARHEEVTQARVIVTRAGEQDPMLVRVDATGGDIAVLKLKRRMESVAPGSLSNDGKVVDDQRGCD